MVDATMSYLVQGFALTPRMIDLGITGMAQSNGEWFAQFAEYPGAQFLLPKPVVDWLLAEGPQP